MTSWICCMKYGLYIWLVLVVVLHVVTAAVPPEIQAAGEEYQKLRKIKGHFEGGEWNEAVDSFNGRKHQVMKILDDYFGKPGSSIGDLTTTMGAPDEVCKSIDGDLASSEQGCSPDGDDGAYLIYKWRAWHDYLWFHQSSGGASPTVVASGWYFAYEQ